LEREEININQVDDECGYSALICACSWKMETVALKLLEREEININQVDDEYGYSALIWACYNKIEKESLQPPLIKIKNYHFLSLFV